MRHPVIFLLNVLTMVLAGTFTLPAASGNRGDSKNIRHALPTATASAFGDLDVMQKRRVIRVAVPYSRSLFFNDKGEQHGITADTLRDFEQWLNRQKQQRATQTRISVIAIPTSRDRMLPMVMEGSADLAVGNLTITPARDAVVDFSEPFATNISEMNHGDRPQPALPI
jgi:ABC-type amino acid transport substrate-binding protein